MQARLTLLFLATAVYAKPVPQGVTEAVSPEQSAPPGCSPSAPGSYGVMVQNVTTATAPVRKREEVSQTVDGQPQVVTGGPVSVISDGQIQAGDHTTTPVAGQIGDGQVQAQTSVYAPVTVLPDGQPQAPTTPPAVSQASDAQPQATAPSEPSQSADNPAKMVSCYKDGTLQITLQDGVLKDSQGRTGYIASNFQFQFDNPPQAGAIYTSGFSACSNSSLALGGSNIFYQCRSGDFFNLYDRSWAAQCSPVTINLLELAGPCPA
ncbi:MAG: hypothetical protein LQ351_007321 [Letrouitia transgressa]|nr:MAG: hypothetical protein LQ351_007321 [Letrouitia transgressa]